MPPAFRARPAVAVLFSSVVALASAPRLTGQPLPAAQVAAIDSFVRNTMQRHRIPGVAVAVVHDGNVVYRKAFGLANLETGTPLTPESVFELASVTKQFTAAAIMLLVQDGKVHLDSAITAYIDSAPPGWSGIKVRHLLNHTSGIFTGGVIRYDNSPLLSVTTRQAFRQIAAARAFGPGRTGFYSDAGYFLLGMIVERASGQTYREFMQRRVFDPLGMTQTSITDRKRVIMGRVATYEIEGERCVNWRRDWDYELPSFFGIWSTLDDVARWDNSVRRHTLLTPASLEQMWTPGRLGDGRDALVDSRLYGFGFRLLDIRGHRVVAHTGASGTLLLHVLDEPLSVIVLTNLSGTEGRHHSVLGDGVVGILRPAYAPPQWIAAQPDRSPEIARTLRTFLTDVAAGRESAVMTPAHTAYLDGLPPIARDPIRQRLAGLGAMTFIACDDVTDRGIRYTDPVARICYYKATAGGRLTFFTTYLTKDGRIAHIRWGGEADL